MQSRHCAVEINVVTVMTSKRFLRCINRLVSCFYSAWVHGLNVALWCTFMCTTCSNDHISASRHLICFSWRLIHCLWYIFVLHTFPLSSHLCASTSLAHISSRWLSPHIPITRSFCRLSQLLCSSPLLSRFPPRSLLHSLQLHRLRSSHILSLLSYLAVCVPFLLPSFNLLKKKKKVQWVTGDSMLWPSFCFQNGAFSSHPPRPLLLSGQPHPKREWVRIDSLKKSICSGICCAGANAGASYLRTLFLETHSTHLSVFCSFVGSNEAQRGTRYSHPDHEYYTDMIPHWLPSLVMGVVGFACSHKGPLK